MFYSNNYRIYYVFNSGIIEAVKMLVLTHGQPKAANF